MVEALWRCPDRHCEVVTWTEQSEAITARVSMTEPARAKALPPGGRAEPLGDLRGPRRRDGSGFSQVISAVGARGSEKIGSRPVAPE